MWTDVVISILEKITKPAIDYTVQSISQSKRLTLYYGQKFALKACNGSYVQTNLNKADTKELIAQGDRVGHWELFEIVNCADPYSYQEGNPVKYGDQVSLRVIETSCFVGVNYNDSQKTVTACVSDPDNWEKITVVVPPKYPKARMGKPICFGNYVAFKSIKNEYIMSNQNKNGLLTATASRIDKWEMFVVINPDLPK
jgi:hypothetical protein